MISVPSFPALLALVCIATTPVIAQQDGAAPEQVISAERFDAFSKNTTLYFNRRGAPYGAEQYFEDRRVIWTFLDGRCERGAWYNEGDTLCFVYETQNEAQCWTALEISGKKHIRVLGDDPGNDLVVVGQDTANLSCPGPGVGVSYTPGS